MSPAGHGKLTNREKEIAELIGEGIAGRAIAARLGIAYYTVRKHRLAILRKLDLHSSAQLAAAASALAVSNLHPPLDLRHAGRL